MHLTLLHTNENRATINVSMFSIKKSRLCILPIYIVKVYPHWYCLIFIL
jgi:hypothetical protein